MLLKVFDTTMNMLWLKILNLDTMFNPVFQELEPHGKMCEIRSVIRFLHDKRTPFVDIHLHLTDVYGDKPISVQHARKVSC